MPDYLAEYQQEAKAIVAESAKELHAPDFGYSGDLPIGETWAWTFSHNRDSQTLDESNWDAITADMRERGFGKDTAIERFGHWAVGWTERLAVRMLDKKGKVTKAGKAIIDWQHKLESYPVADEEELSRREYERSIENIASEGQISEEEAKLVFDWLWSNNQEALTHTEESGVYYPARKDIQTALDAEGEERFYQLQRKNRRKNKDGEFEVDQLSLVKDVIVRREGGGSCSVTVFTGYRETFPDGFKLAPDDDLPCDLEFDVKDLVGLADDEATEYLNWRLREFRKDPEMPASETEAQAIAHDIVRRGKTA